MMAPYLCFRFRIFDILVLEEYVFRVEEGPHLLQSCLRAMQDGLLPTTKEMHPSFKNLVITNAPSLHVPLMDIHHDMSLRSILENDSISSCLRVHIHFCLGKGVGLWLVVRPFICLFHIAHSTFTSTLCFHLALIQPLASSFLMCECWHRLDASNTHLVRYLLGSQQITTHDAIWDIMYAFTWKNGGTPLC
jgi:hypothetical protein